MDITRPPGHGYLSEIRFSAHVLTTGEILIIIFDFFLIIYFLNFCLFTFCQELFYVHGEVGTTTPDALIHMYMGRVAVPDYIYISIQKMQGFRKVYFLKFAFLSFI